METARREREEAARQGIETLAAASHAALPRDAASAVGAIYVRYSTRHQDSVLDQVRDLLAYASRQQIFVPLENIFYDLAVRGYKDRRPGLNRLRALLQAKGAQVLLVFATNRLFRKTYKALQFVEEEVIERGLRCVFVHTGVDTSDDKRWQTMLQVHALMDEFGAGMYAENIRASQQSLFAQGLVSGTVPFGYRGDPIPGQFTRRKTPRCRLVVDPETARWVRQIFDWFVNDRVALQEIVRRLNADPDIPLTPKAITNAWTYTSVSRLLSNARYRGHWVYGKTKAVWQGRKDYSRQVERDAPLREEQLEELRLVPDDLWYAAQRRLEEFRRDRGRKAKDGNRRSRPKLLNGLMWCPQHDRALYVGGPNGRYMFCLACRGMPANERSLYSALNRTLATRLTCETLARLVSGDEALAAQVVACCQREAKRWQEQDPEQERSLVQRAQKLSVQIKFVMNNVGETESDRREATEELQRLRRDRRDVQAQIAALRAAQGRPSVVPTEEEVQGLMGQLADILMNAAVSTREEEIGLAHEIIKMLVGGRIDLYQQGDCRSHGGWLQGRFHVNLLPYLLGRAGAKSMQSGDEGIEISIDYRHASTIGNEAEKAKELLDQGYLVNEVAAELGTSRNRVRKILEHWYDTRGLPVPDFRGRRQGLTRKQGTTPLYVQLADKAKAFMDKGLTNLQIAQQLSCSGPTVGKALRHWHKSRGLEAPRRDSRREELLNRVSELYSSGLMLADIAKAVGLCGRSVKLLVREFLEAQGKIAPDGRSRRASTNYRHPSVRPKNGMLTQDGPPP